MGDAITVTFTSSEEVQDPPTVTIGGTSATVSGSGTSWSATRTLTSSDANGAIAFAVDFLDLASNAGTQVTSSTDGSTVTLDQTPPTLTAVAISSNNSASNLAKVNDNVTISFTADENIQDPPVVSIGGASATVSGSDAT